VFLDIPKDGISITIHGNYLSKIASAFKSLFMGKIRDEIQKQLISVIKKELPP